MPEFTFLSACVSMKKHGKAKQAKGSPQQWFCLVGAWREAGTGQEWADTGWWRYLSMVFWVSNHVTYHLSKIKNHICFPKWQNSVAM